MLEEYLNKIINCDYLEVLRKLPKRLAARIGSVTN